MMPPLPMPPPPPLPIPFNPPVQHRKVELHSNDPLFPPNWKSMTKLDHAKHIEETLRGNRKLVLFLDVDHTLLHSTRDPKARNYQSHAVFGGDIHPIDFPNPYNATYFIKFRPYFYQFINVVSELFYVVLYTMGSRPYAEEVARVIDRHMHKNIIGDRIVCREDHDDVLKGEKKKGLIKCQKKCEHKINDEKKKKINDTPEIWINMVDVHRVPKYLFWPDSDLNDSSGGNRDNGKSKNSSPSEWTEESLFQQNKDNMLLQLQYVCEVRFIVGCCVICVSVIFCSNKEILFFFRHYTEPILVNSFQNLAR
ncbi:hypothetical protein RFI_23036 [Reticulomyxa filosa]|uniref:protein-serine/threonine phosphatase n=1 Tax=Reticulomyxa filosa TaxID=46433 RepID=X6MKE7_RETFI|nr:hypothetical protein RFI_23036 [Reticulomyxa filosa]|eukprot:ETO14334.1 hypothetical protein RFI_23036 [Reticulomyxa filosa]